MTVAVITAKVDAGLSLVTITGTTTEVTNELAAGTVAGKYRWKRHEHSSQLKIGLGSTTTTASAAWGMYLVDVSDQAP